MTIFNYSLADDSDVFKVDGTKYDFNTKVYNQDLTASNGLSDAAITLIYGQDVSVTISNNSIGVQPETGMLVSSTFTFQNMLNLKTVLAENSYYSDQMVLAFPSFDKISDKSFVSFVSSESLKLDED